MSAQLSAGVAIALGLAVPVGGGELLGRGASRLAAAYLALKATGGDLVHPLRDLLLFFVFPLTVITLGVTGWRSLRGRAARGSPPDSGSEGGA